MVIWSLPATSSRIQCGVIRVIVFGGLTCQCVLVGNEKRHSRLPGGTYVMNSIGREKSNDNVQAEPISTLPRQPDNTVLLNSLHCHVIICHIRLIGEYHLQQWKSRQARPYSGTAVYPHMPIVRPHAARSHERRISSAAFSPHAHWTIN